MRTCDPLPRVNATVVSVTTMDVVDAVRPDTLMLLVPTVMIVSVVMLTSSNAARARPGRSTRVSELAIARRNFFMVMNVRLVKKFQD